MEISKYKNLILVDKPKGITSFDVIRQLREKISGDVGTLKKQIKIGHAGTLDPRASGLMLIGVGEGTKKLKDLIGLPKVYIAEILFGIKTNTGDFDPKYPEGEGESQNGKIIEEKDASHLTREGIEKALESLRGDTVLEVSLFSAMKRKGKSLYKYARAGQKITKPKRVMTVYRADLKKWAPDTHIIEVEFEVGSGTYIRSLAEELGERLGTVATLQNLRRTSVGNFRIGEAKTIEKYLFDKLQ